MKDSEFLELLNLYLDHEIAAADAARLEAEVKDNPDHRRTYLEYCRMQKACTLLAKDFASEPAEKKVIAFEPNRSSWARGAFCRRRTCRRGRLRGTGDRESRARLRRRQRTDHARSRGGDAAGGTCARGC